MGGKRQKPLRTREQTEAARAKLRAKRTVKLAKKEKAVERKLGKAIKKAKDFEIRKLKRRLRELERAEENPKDAEGEESDQSEASSSDTDSGSAEDQGMAEPQKPSRDKLKYERGSKVSIEKQLSLIKPMPVQEVAKDALKELLTSDAGEEDAAEQPNLQMVGPDAETNKLIVAKLLRTKAVETEMREGKALLKKIKDNNARWEASIIRADARKAAAEAAAEARKQAGLDDGTANGEEIGQQDTATPLKVPRKRKLNPDKHGSLGVKGKKIKKEAVAGKKGKKKKAGKRAGQEMNGVKRNKDKYSREGRQALKAGAGALHPSWSAKRQQNAGIGQAIQGRKTVFNE